MPRGGKALTTADWVARVIAKRGDRYDYSKVVYLDYVAKVTIVCRTHGDFKQSANRHMQGDNCPHCANEARRLAPHSPLRTDTRRHNTKAKFVEPDFGPLLAAWR